VGNFYTDIIVPDLRFHSLTQVRDLNMLEPFTKDAVLAIIRDAGNQGIDLRVSETYRSQDLQAQDFARHASELKTVGVHHYGLACDFFKVVNGQATWNGDWSFLCGLAKKYGLISGGDWGRPDISHSFHDWDHVQRVALIDQPRLFNNSWYPASDYNPYESLEIG
jgi:hypothetical protein